jgi:hypothetical protein
MRNQVERPLSAEHERVCAFYALIDPKSFVGQLSLNRTLERDSLAREDTDATNYLRLDRRVALRRRQLRLENAVGRLAEPNQNLAIIFRVSQR